MPEPTILERPFPQSRLCRWRLRLLILTLIILPLGLFAASFYFLILRQEIDLRQALSETDQQDPGWRIWDLEAKRAVIPNEHNAAVRLMAAKKLLPPQWPKQRLAMQQNLWQVEPPVRMMDQQVALLRQELAGEEGAVAEARKVADLPYGRYPFRLGFDNLTTRPLHTIETRFLADLLADDVFLRIQQEDAGGALRSCRAILNAARALGDEPLPYSIAERSIMHHIALHLIERSLAQGQPTESSLAAMQRLLEDEAAQPLFLIGSRGARALQDSALESLQKRTSSINDVWMVLEIGRTPFGSNWDQLGMRTESVRTARAALLRFNNQIVEVAKRPPEEQRQALRQLAASQSKLPRLVRDAPAGIFGLGRTWHLDLAWMRCGIVMVAAERYRRAHGRWPEALTDLVPAYLTNVPTDPYHGSPLRLGRFAQGISLYSVGEDGKDNGGNLRMPMVAGTDMGWRLWDVRYRRQAAGK
jgi:hypothetical protein